MKIVALIIVILVSFASITYGIIEMKDPNKLAFLGEKWRYKDEPELSDAGEHMAFLGGIFKVVFGAMFLIFGMLAVFFWT